MKKILLIEDNINVRENTAEILQLANYNVITAKNGKIGVELAQSEKPDLIICDIMMPVLDGYGVLHLLSKNSETDKIPFIFLTAKAERVDLRKGMDMGADDYLTKPFDDIELLNAIESRLRKVDLIKKGFTDHYSELNNFINNVKKLEDLQKFSPEHEIRNFKRKENIYKEDTYPRGVFLINKGKVKTYRITEQGKEFITGLYKEGDFFGYLALLEDTKYVDTAEALDDTDSCFIPKDDFLSLLFKNAEVSKKFMKLLANNLNEKEQQLVKLAYNSVRKRVAEALVTLYNRYRKEEEVIFSMQLFREDLANLAGTATETTIRTLSDFKDEGLIEIKGSMISILKIDKLIHLYN